MSALIAPSGHAPTRATPSAQALAGKNAPDAAGLPKLSSSIDDKRRFDDYLNDTREPARSNEVDRDEILSTTADDEPTEKIDVDSQMDDTRDSSRDLDRKDSANSAAEDESAAAESNQDAKTAAEPQDASESEDPTAEPVAVETDPANGQANAVQGNALEALNALVNGTINPLAQAGAKPAVVNDAAKQSAGLSPEAKAVAAASGDAVVAVGQGEQGGSGQSLGQGFGQGLGQAFGQSGGQASGQGLAADPGAISLDGTVKFGQSSVLQTEAANTPVTVPAAAPSGGQLTEVAGKGANAQQAINALQDASNPGSDANAARLARGMRSAVMQQNGSVTLRLTPNAMGTVRIELNVQGGAVQASLSAETDGARQLLQQQIGHLKTALESQGLTVQRLEIQSMQPQQQSGSQNTDDQASADGRGRQSHAGRQDQQSRRDENGQRFEDLAQELNQDPAQGSQEQASQGLDPMNEGAAQ